MNFVINSFENERKSEMEWNGISVSIFLKSGGYAPVIWCVASKFKIKSRDVYNFFYKQLLLKMLIACFSQSKVVCYIFWLIDFHTEIFPNGEELISIFMFYFILLEC